MNIEQLGVVKDGAPSERCSLSARHAQALSADEVSPSKYPRRDSKVRLVTAQMAEGIWDPLTSKSRCSLQSRRNGGVHIASTSAKNVPLTSAHLTTGLRPNGDGRD